jgi:hypothetical protein
MVLAGGRVVQRLDLGAQWATGRRIEGEINCKFAASIGKSVAVQL